MPCLKGPEGRSRFSRFETEMRCETPLVFGWHARRDRVTLRRCAEQSRWPVGVSLAAERIRSLTERGSRATSGAQHLDDQIDQALCLTLVTNAAVLWTTTHLGYALDAPRR